MKKLITILLLITLSGSLISACTHKLCPAYRSYPSKRGN